MYRSVAARVPQQSVTLPRFVGRVTRHVFALACVGLGAGNVSLEAQPLRDQLSTLLTAQGAVPAGQAPDAAAAERSRQALVGLMGVELASAPSTSGASGFIYELNPALGVVQRASDSFGAFFTERALRVGEGQAAFGLLYQSASFSALGGNDLSRGSFPVNAVRTRGGAAPYAVDALRLDLATRTLTTRVVYGLTDTLEVGGTLPFVQTRLDGTRVTSYGGQPVFEVLQEGSSSGLGDASLTVRYRVVGHGGTGVAIGSDLRLPTGRAADLLGTGEVAVRGQVIASWEDGPLAASATGGVGRGGASDELFWGGAVTVAASPSVTMVGEVIGRRLGDVHSLIQVYEPHSVLGGVESMRWVADPTSPIAIGYAVAGVKWNVTGTVLLGANLLVRLTDAGLRARVTPALTIDYDFGL